MNALLEPPNSQPRRELRLGFYWLLIIAAAGVMTARVLNVASEKGDSPFLSANDRSRWCTVRAIVDEGTYEIDQVMQDIHPKTKRRSWQTIDMVRHKGRDGRQHYYSSKPPLFSTLLAGQYWLIEQATGATLRHETFYVVRWMLLITNVSPLVVYFVLLMRFVERWGTTDWGRMYVASAALWGTFVTTFAVTLNNHVPAAVCALIAVCSALPIWTDGERRWRFYAAAGLFSALAAANELPALALAALLGGALLWTSPRRALAGFLPPAALVAAAFFSANYIAHDSWRPPYSHRADGPLVGALDASLAQQLADGKLPQRLRERLEGIGVRVSLAATVTTRQPGRRWELQDPESEDRWAIVHSGERLLVHVWDDWYDYDGSYWRPENRKGVDRGEPRWEVYALHALVGHHGLLSLTPIWLLSAAGAGILLLRRGEPLRPMALLTASLTAVCLTFYLTRPLEDRNYGGVSCCFRWMFWFTPLWLLCLLPAADAMSRNRWRRCVGLALLLVSIISANYAAANPWSPPWIYDYLEYLGWLHY